jgi:hypothetical protein
LVVLNFLLSLRKKCFYDETNQACFVGFSLATHATSWAESSVAGVEKPVPGLARRTEYVTNAGVCEPALGVHAGVTAPLIGPECCQLPFNRYLNKIGT